MDEDRVESSHPYLSGNFAPVQHVQPLTPCTYSGKIPDELIGGQYVRNGGNPVVPGQDGREAHWFDGDGMLTGVLFRRSIADGVQPNFVNKFVLTDVYLSARATPWIKKPIMTSIATLINPANSMVRVIVAILRTVLLVVLSHLPGSKHAIKRISVANTGILYHDGRALATCESGPPMRVSLPGLETVGWFNGIRAEGEEPFAESEGPGFAGYGISGFMQEWTTGHPRKDPRSLDLILFHSSFAAPYVHYSVLPNSAIKSVERTSRIMNAPVPGIATPKMMHDFGVSHNYTVILDLPLSLSALNMLNRKPMLFYDPSSVSRYGIFPRYHPEMVRWFTTKACCVFHTANTWDSQIGPTGEERSIVNMLVCRLTSASVVYNAGNIAYPSGDRVISDEEEQCRLYYYQFDVSPSVPENKINHQFALSSVNAEFPILRDDCSMEAARYVYCCSASNSPSGATIGTAVKIDALVKFDVQNLIAQGVRSPRPAIVGCVDTRSIADIAASCDPHDPIKVFQMPFGWYAQECRFVPRVNGMDEDDGWLLTYVFDESQLSRGGKAPSTAKSELWIIDARTMTDVVARIHLPQRVPYGLHGCWFSEEEIGNQKPVDRFRDF